MKAMIKECLAGEPNTGNQCFQGLGQLCSVLSDTLGMGGENLLPSRGDEVGGSTSLHGHMIVNTDCQLKRI